ncbi:MAG: hypothetical protein MUD08_16500, partial [Cytophagales bacterium]|nr:hypothetical protein [Cytophagales bacterium]
FENERTPQDSRFGQKLPKTAVLHVASRHSVMQHARSILNIECVTSKDELLENRQLATVKTPNQLFVLT